MLVNALFLDLLTQLFCFQIRNDESADLLGNFDDSKRKGNDIDAEFNHSDDNDMGSSNEENDADDQDVSDESVNDGQMEVNDSTDRSVKIREKKSPKEYNGKISQDQISSLLRGSTKANRFVLYVTNLNFGTSKERLTEYFSTSGAVKTVRIPKKRKGGFAFVEMSDIDGFRVRFLNCLLIL